MASLAVGLVYETFASYPRAPDDPPDFDAEYEPEATVEALEAAIRCLGHVPVRLGTPLDVLHALGERALPRLDAALSIAEGRGSRNREAWAPVLLEMAGIPQLGSDALTLSLSLDKAWTHAVVARAGVPVPPHRSVASAEEAARLPLPCPFPLFVKPRWEGTGKGIRESSRVESREALLREVDHVVRTYRQPALLEAFVEGPEYTVTLAGNAPPRALPVLQRALEARTRIGLHALERRGHAPPPEGYAHLTPGKLEPPLEEALRVLALRVFEALACRDFARADFRLDPEGRPVFLEMNPLPTFAPDGSFAILAELEGRTLPDLLAEILGEGLRRLGLAGRSE